MTHIPMMLVWETDGAGPPPRAVEVRVRRMLAELARLVPGGERGAQRRRRSRWLRTSSSEEAIIESLGTLEQEIQAAVDEDRQGFRGGWISTHFLDLLLRDTGIRMARNKRRDVLIEMVYMAHPGLQNGQVNNPIQPDGCKPRLFIRPEHHSVNMRGGDVAKAYSDDQAGANPFVRVVASGATGAGS